MVHKIAFGLMLVMVAAVAAATTEALFLVMTPATQAAPAPVVSPVLPQERVAPRTDGSPKSIVV
jgi:hypothetical protein